jgi:PAS domain S-box-containing protein
MPEDLTAGVASSVGGSATLVALRDDPLAPAMTVRGATDPTLVGTPIASSNGALNRVCFAGAPAFSTPAECEAELAPSLQKHGIRVLVAPIATTANTWGAVAVVQRRGSLFPDDDLRVLAQLGRYAGTALDHARLVQEARDRERRTADRRLREAESRMSLMLDSIKDYAMFIMDDGGKVVTWHPGAEHVFGYTSAEMRDEPAGPLFEVSAEKFAVWLKDARELGISESETTCRRKDGGKFSGATIIRPLADHGEGLSGFVAVTRDVTERRELETRLRQSQKMEAIGQLAGGIAHDFNNNLTAIMGFAEVLKMELRDDARGLDRVNDIVTAGQRAAGLTRQLLQFSRRQLFKMTPVNMARVVSDMLPTLQRVLGAHVDIQHDLPAGLPPVMADRTQLEQIIFNLGANAGDAMPTGGQLSIRVSSVWLDESTAGEPVDVGTHIQLEFADTGVGMDETTQARIFEPFFTTKDMGRGTGLGLATVYGIVKQMGGVIRVASQPGMGATFRLYFPAARLPEAPSMPGEPPALAGGTETLLVVEDDASVRAFLTEVLQKQGYRVIAAENRLTALIRAQAHPGAIDLVVTDVVMPGGSGPELVRELADFRPGVPALYISGYADAVMAQHGGFPKASHFLQKPFSAADLLARIRLILTSS